MARGGRNLYLIIFTSFSHENGLEDENLRCRLVDKIDSIDNPIHPSEVRHLMKPDHYRT